MSRRLLILRHAKSSWDSKAKTDSERPLAKRGKKDAPRLGVWMRKQGLIPDHVISSPAKRAKQTADRVCKELGIKMDKMTWDHRIYDAGLQELLYVLHDCPTMVKTVMLVGHNPGLEMLLTYLGADSVVLPEDGKLLPTAALAELTMPEEWAGMSMGVAHLESITRVRSLPKKL